MAPALRAPMPRARDKQMASVLPVPFCSEEMKRGNPEPFSKRVRTEVPIMRRASMTRSAVEGMESLE